MNPQIYGWLYERLFDAGALDVWTTPIVEAVRRMAKVETHFGDVQCKVSALNGKIVSISPNMKTADALSKKIPCRSKPCGKKLSPVKRRGSDKNQSDGRGIKIRRTGVTILAAEVAAQAGM